MFRTILGVFVVCFAVAIQVHALVCHKCEGNQAGGCGVPGGQKMNETCNAGVKYCEVKFVNNKAVKKGCSNVTAIPAGYKAVAGDPEKSCKTSKGNVEKHCLCSENRCNENDKPFKGGATSFQTAGLGMLVLAAVHFFVC
eukprot:TRINITY_DN1096_c0_g1_i12.p1 TRINITY_DN1096_c0_g1~~TRINITY_DN1096_c0_g1_i12.p1  ORF type:complete len:140 (+),score=27.27 TRINITY_DN1096_c0_g1_i12:103-522(+)